MAANTVHLPQYPEFHVTEDPEISSKWEEWLEGFEAMIGAMKVTVQAEQRKMMMYYIGAGGRKIVKRLEDAGDGTGATPYADLKNALDNHFKSKLNRVYGMNMLHQVVQRPGETIDNFLIRVREKVAVIEIDKLDKNAIIDLITLAHMVNHCNNKQVKHKAIRDDLSLQDFLKSARAAERAEHQMKEMEHSTSSMSESVNRVSRPKEKSDRKRGSKWRSQSKHRGKSKSPQPERRNKMCFRCGGPYPHESECPAMNATCGKCSRVGHYAKRCHTKMPSKEEVSSVQVVKSASRPDDYSVIPCVYSVNSRGSTKWTTMILCDRDVKMMIDSGSEINIIDEPTFSQLDVKREELQHVSRTYCGYGPRGNRIPIDLLGKFEVYVKCPLTKLMTKTDVHVMRGEANNLLSCETSEKLKLIKFAELNHVKRVEREDMTVKYSDRFQGIGKMKHTVVTLNINKDVKPVIQKPRRVQFHLRDKLDNEIDELMKADIIEEATGPTEWLSPPVLELKPTGNVRVCIDSRVINTAIERERHPMPTTEDLIVKLNGAKYFSKIDLNKGYHQLELAEESRPITTFSTHNKTYRYKRLCFGINSAAEIFQRAVSDMLRGIPGQLNMSDDIIIFSKTEAEHKATLDQVFERLREYNVTANKKKCEFWQNRVSFFGHVFSEEGIEPSMDKVKAIVEASEPKTPDEVRSLLGMCQYLSRFIPNYSTVVEPLRELTKSKSEWSWTEKHERAFEDLKTSLANWKKLKYFDVKAHTELLVDASPIGLGAVLTQVDASEKVQAVEYASRKLTETERNYSQSERELLAIVWACEHFDHYLIGADFTVITDHEPLIGIMGKPESKPTARLHRLSLRLQPYSIKLKYKPGKDNPADYLSRHPAKSAIRSVSKFDEDTERACVSTVSYYSVQGAESITFQELQEETARDEVIQEVMKCVVNKGWNNLNCAVHSDYKSYKNIQDELSVVKGVLVRDDRVVVPEQLRERAVRLAHSSHQGIVKTKQLMRETIWFPGIDKMVEREVKNCLACQSTINSGTHREPLKMTKMPEESWREVAMDFLGPFKGGEYLLVVIDERSRYPEVEIVYSTSHRATIPALDAIFARQGIPEIAKSDNGPPFNSSEFGNWCRYIGMHHRKVTPLWPEANAEAERFMRTLNKALRAAQMDTGSWKQELFKFLRHYRATPHSTTGMSPSELLNKRKLRTELPCRVRRKCVRFQDEVELAERRDKRLKEYMRDVANNDRNARPSDVEVGDMVLARQPKTNKLSTPFDAKPYKVTQTKGSMVTAERSDKSITRNSSHFKKISNACAKQSKQTLSEYESEMESEPTDASEDNVIVVPDPVVSPPRANIDTDARRPQRSAEAKQLPAKYKDFAMPRKK